MLTVSECLPRKTFCRHSRIYGLVPILALLSRGDPGTKEPGSLGDRPRSHSQGTAEQEQEPDYLMPGPEAFIAAP